MPKIFGTSWGVVVAATLAFFIFGWIWYTVFQDQWLVASGMTEEQSIARMESIMPLGFPIAAILISLGQAIGLLMVIHYAGARSIGSCVKIAFWLALCFAATILAYACIYVGYSLSGYLVDLGHLLFGWMIAGAVYGFFRNKAAEG